MKKVININFQGRVIPIEESAYEILKRYTESLSIYFANEEGRDEIINDIEGRIAELFGDILKKGSTCITDQDVEGIIASMGRPEDFDGDEAKVQSKLSSDYDDQKSYQQTSQGKRLYRDENHKFMGGVCAGIANYFNIDPVIVRILTLVFMGVTLIPYFILWIVVPSSASTSIGAQRKRLFRDPDNRFIGGVCSGLAQYFGLSIWIPRVLFLAPFFLVVFRNHGWGFWNFPNFFSLSFSPTALLVYIILWIVVPEAKSAADKLEMKGEKVDLNNIKTTIQGDLVGLKDRTQQAGAELKERAMEIGETIQAKGRQMRSEADPLIKKSRRNLGDIIIFLVKIVAYFFAGCLLLALALALFTFGILSTGLIPVKDYLLKDGWQTTLAWATLILGVWVPIIGIFTFIIRRLAKKRGNSTTLRSSFFALWIVGVFCAVGLGVSLASDFRYHNYPVEENIRLSNANVSKLEIRASWFGNYHNRHSWFKLEPFASFEEDTVYVRNIRLRIVKSDNDSFKVTMAKVSNGSSRQDASRNAQNIMVRATQKDTALLFTKGIAITTHDKFRNQHAIVTISVPVGKRIKIGEDEGWGEGFSVHVGTNSNFWDWDDDVEQKSYWWRPNIEYIMTNTGLEKVSKNCRRR